MASIWGCSLSLPSLHPPSSLSLRCPAYSQVHPIPRIPVGAFSIPRRVPPSFPHRVWSVRLPFGVSGFSVQGSCRYYKSPFVPIVVAALWGSVVPGFRCFAPRWPTTWQTSGGAFPFFAAARGSARSTPSFVPQGEYYFKRIKGCGLPNKLEGRC